MQPIILETTKFDKQPGYMGLFSLEPATLIQSILHYKNFSGGFLKSFRKCVSLIRDEVFSYFEPNLCYFLIASFSTLYTHPLLSAKNNLSDT